MNRILISHNQQTRKKTLPFSIKSLVISSTLMISLIPQVASAKPVNANDVAKNSKNPATSTTISNEDMLNALVEQPDLSKTHYPNNGEEDISNYAKNEGFDIDDSTDGIDIGVDTTRVPLGAIAPITIQRFVKLIDTTRREYVKPVNDEELFANAMMGVLTNLDPYSEYLDSTAYENLRLFTEGDIGSIGAKARFDKTQHHWIFYEVIPESPAAKAGIQNNDFLHQINDVKLQNEQTQQDVNQLLSGIAGTQLRLMVSNQGRRKRSITLQRTLVEQQNVQAKIVNGIAIVHIPIFQNNTQQQMLDALTNLGEPFSAILIDVRNNPGGVLTSANDIASLFMQDKTVVQVHNRQGIQEIVKTHGKPRLATLPIVILQNRYSASASEVLASSLQENNRAKILGETSYGKGSIQTVVPLMDNDALKLTVAHYYSGKGKKIDGIGIKPDVELTDNELTWEEQAVSYLIAQPRPNSYIFRNSHQNPQEF